MTLHKPPYCAKSLGAQIDRMVVGLRAKKQGKNIADMSGSNKWFNARCGTCSLLEHLDEIRL
jgi:hypothetical protein